MDTLRNNIKLAQIIPAKAYAATENLRAIDMLGLTAASVTLAMATKPIANDTLTIGTKVYTFQDTLSDTDGHVYIGSTVADSQANLVHAINLNGGTVGVDYATSTTKHPYVTASEFVANVLTLTAKSAGTDGNSLAATETLTAAGNVFSAATFTGGRDDVSKSQSALVMLSIGDITGLPTSVKVKIQEADDIAFGTAPTTALGGEEITITAALLRNSLQRFEVTAVKRYIRAVVTFTGGTTPTASLGAVALISDLAVPFPVVLQNV